VGFPMSLIIVNAYANFHFSLSGVFVFVSKSIATLNKYTTDIITLPRYEVSLE